MSECPYGCYLGKLVKKKRYKYCMRTYCSRCGRWIRGDEIEIINLGKMNEETCRNLRGVIVKGNCLVRSRKRMKDTTVISMDRLHSKMKTRYI